MMMMMMMMMMKVTFFYVERVVTMDDSLSHSDKRNDDMNEMIKMILKKKGVLQQQT